MSLATVLLSPEALNDLDEIWIFIAENDVAAADRNEQTLRSAITLLAGRPGIGHLRQDLTDQPVRFWPVDDYLIIYGYSGRRLEVVRVLHGARDVTRLF